MNIFNRFGLYGWQIGKQYYHVGEEVIVMEWGIKYLAIIEGVKRYKLLGHVVAVKYRCARYISYGSTRGYYDSRSYVWQSALRRWNHVPTPRKKREIKHHIPKPIMTETEGRWPANEQSLDPRVYM